jgi:hypothetical protein
VGDTERCRCLLCAEEESDFHVLLTLTETQSWREQLLKSKWPRTRIDEEISLRKVLTLKNATEQRNVDTLAYILN